MDKIAAYEMVLEDHSLWEKTAFLVYNFIPVGTALGGSVLGGVGGALSTDDPEQRKKRILGGAVAGGLAGGLGGEALLHALNKRDYEAFIARKPNSRVTFEGRGPRGALSSALKGGLAGGLTGGLMSAAATTPSSE